MISETAEDLFGKVTGMQSGGTAGMGGARRGSSSTRRGFNPYAKRVKIFQLPPEMSGAPFPVFVNQFGSPVSPRIVERQMASGGYELVQGLPPNVQLKTTGGAFERGYAPEIAALENADTDTDTGGGGAGGYSSGGGSQQSSFSESYQPVVPPVLDILTEMRTRRQAAREAALANFQAIAQTAPVMSGDLPFMPGYEPGGMHDTLMGQVSGRGTEAEAGRTPWGYRQPKRIPLPGLMNPNEPDMEAEFGQGMGLANQILANIISVLTGRSGSQSTSSQWSSGSNGGSSSSGSTTDEDYFNDILNALPVQ